MQKEEASAANIEEACTWQAVALAAVVVEATAVNVEAIKANQEASTMAAEADIGNVRNFHSKS